jgi:hypothetical protein
MSDDDGVVRPISSARSVRREEHPGHGEDPDKWAHRIAEQLTTNGSTVIACNDDADRDRARRAARRAGAIIGHRVATRTVEGGLAVWDTERERTPEDIQHANRLLDAAYKRRGPLLRPPDDSPQE